MKFLKKSAAVLAAIILSAGSFTAYAEQELSNIDMMRVYVYEQNFTDCYVYSAGFEDEILVLYTGHKAELEAFMAENNIPADKVTFIQKQTEGDHEWCLTYANEILFDNGSLVTYKNGLQMSFPFRTDFRMYYEVPAEFQGNVNELLGLTEKHKLVKSVISNKDINLYYLNLETAEEAEKLLEAAKILCKDSKLTNAYSKCTMEGGLALNYSHPGGLVNALAYGPRVKNYVNYPPVLEYISLGDANHDDILDVRDAAYLSKRLSKDAAYMLPDGADFNEDGTINVRDAAAIAGYLAKK